MVIGVDLILTMDIEQKRYLEQKYPTARGKVFRLGDADIPDPYRQDMAVFRQTYNLLSQGVAALVERVAPAVGMQDITQLHFPWLRTASPCVLPFSRHVS